MEKFKENEEGENSMKSLDNTAGKKSGSTLLYFKIAFFPVLLGALALGGFWGYTKIREGMMAAGAITNINEKISRLESNQKAIQEKLDEIISGVDRVSKSGKIIAEIPKSIQVLEKKIDSLGALAHSPQNTAMTPERAGAGESGGAAIPAPEAVEPGKAEPIPELYGEAGQAPEEKMAGKETGDLGTFMKALFHNMKKAVYWTWVKLQWLYHEIVDVLFEMMK